MRKIPSCSNSALCEEVLVFTNYSERLSYFGRNKQFIECL
jgi:hypothetical protein